MVDRQLHQRELLRAARLLLLTASSGLTKEEPNQEKLRFLSGPDLSLVVTIVRALSTAKK